MIIVNTENIKGKNVVKTIGIVKGSCVRAKWFGKDIIAGFRNLIGGEMKDESNEARKIAIERMELEAKNLGANAIVNIRFTTSSIANGASEILVYGTALKVK